MDRYNGYVYGSAAPKLPERVERPAARPEVQKREALRPVRQKADIPKARMIFAMVFMAAVCFLILYRFSVITELNYQMGKLNDEYNRLRDENRRLKVEIETSIDLDNVRKVAETELNMHEPERYQLVLVSVPKSNYSVVIDHEYINETTQNASLMDNILKTLRAVLP